MEHVRRCAITALKNTSGLNLEDTAHIGSILRPIIQQNLPRGMHNLKFPGSALLSQKIKRLRGSSSSSSSPISYDEIETYHSINFEFIGDDDVDKFDILHWWREHEKYFPILSIIAKQILATPVSTVAVEQEFSAGGNILDAKRSLLSPESIQVQVCVDDWTKAGYRQQEMEPEVIYDFFDDDHTTGTGTDGSD
ncbi:hypothetical protein Ddye_031169 [Dipteronia dyeriana]|uniref:HAT C-terminal dimerisation domain-containing protein n=1 Tax=Dipteronia dyeriana TaxID=168575 RepID=A0AAD9WN85_9ROSI|nr:hypothetical protein Ddye_031169 [Dipteronia dyeriana]